MDPAAVSQLGDDTRVPYYEHTSKQGQRHVTHRRVSTFISMDKLSRDFLELPEDRILVIGDQALLVNLYKQKGLKDPFLIKPCTEETAIDPIDQPVSIGGPVQNFYQILRSLGDIESHEILLYISGHGLHPGNIGLIPDGISAHPAHTSLDDPLWRKPSTEEEGYVSKFYKACYNAKICESRFGFVGGEAGFHQRGYIGVLGVLALWCHYNKDVKKGHHLVIVADCCYSGIWGKTLKKLVISDDSSPMLKECRQVLSHSPISIQCTTDEFEESYAGFFTPLWYWINTELNADIARVSSDEYENSDTAVSQTPFYASTSRARPSWEIFDDPKYFNHLHNKALKAILTVDTSDTLKFRIPYGIALDAQREYYAFLLRNAEIKETNAPRMQGAGAANLVPVIAGNETVAKETANFYDRPLHAVYKDLFEIYMPRRSSLLPDLKLKGNLSKKKSSTIKREIAHNDIPAGVYVFPGGKGDMSLIVTPDQDEVILIDGTKTHETFRWAWDSVLKRLKKITSIYVTHHDEDHTFGIEVLLTRYVLELEDCPHLEDSRLPQLKGTKIYMNTKRHFLATKGYNNENNLVKLITKLKKADFSTKEKLGVEMCPVTVQEMPHIQLETRKLTIIPVLPTKTLVEEVKDKLGDGTKQTMPVSGKGGTTAANVLSIALVAVWNKTDAYFFTGDAHLTDVTSAAKAFLRTYPEIKSFKYVDVPHHGSEHSNRTDVSEEERGLACIPAKNYLISHDGCNSTPHPKTIADILKRRRNFKLHFLYPEREKAINIPCTKCGAKEKTWHGCVKDENDKCIGRELIRVIDTQRSRQSQYYKFFEFTA